MWKNKNQSIKKKKKTNRVKLQSVACSPGLGLSRCFVQQKHKRLTIKIGEQDTPSRALFTQARAKQKQGTISPADNWIYIYIFLYTHTQAIYTHTETLPEEFLQTGVTEPVPTGGHLDGLPHRLAAERTLEAPLRLLQELVVEAGHVCGARGRFLSLSRGLRVKKKNDTADALLFCFSLLGAGSCFGGAV